MLREKSWRWLHRDKESEECMEKAATKLSRQVWEEGVSQGRGRRHHQQLWLAGSAVPDSHWWQAALLWAKINLTWPLWSAAQGRQDKQSPERENTHFTRKRGDFEEFALFIKQAGPHTGGLGAVCFLTSKVKKGNMCGALRCFSSLLCLLLSKHI